MPLDKQKKTMAQTTLGRQCESWQWQLSTSDITCLCNSPAVIRNTTTYKCRERQREQELWLLTQYLPSHCFRLLRASTKQNYYSRVYVSKCWLQYLLWPLLYWPKLLCKYVHVVARMSHRQQDSMQAKKHKHFSMIKRWKRGPKCQPKKWQNIHSLALLEEFL